MEEGKNVHVLALVVLKREYDKYKDLLLDDLTGTFVARTFDLDLSEIKPGDIVFISGYIREYQEKKRIYIKNIKKISEEEFFFWKIRQINYNNFYYELTEEHIEEENKQIEEKKEKEEIEVDIPIEIEDIEIEEFDPKEYILKIIEESPNKEISIDELYKKANKLSKEEIDKILEELSDELFEPRPGIIKKIEI